MVSGAPQNIPFGARSATAPSAVDPAARCHCATARAFKPVTTTPSSSHMGGFCACVLRATQSVAVLVSQRDR